MLQRWRQNQTSPSFGPCSKRAVFFFNLVPFTTATGWRSLQYLNSSIVTSYHSLYWLENDITCHARSWLTNFGSSYIHHDFRWYNSVLMTSEVRIGNTDQNQFWKLPFRHKSTWNHSVNWELTFEARFFAWKSPQNRCFINPISIHQI